MADTVLALCCFVLACSCVFFVMLSVKLTASLLNALEINKQLAEENQRLRKITISCIYENHVN